MENKRKKIKTEKKKENQNLPKIQNGHLFKSKVIAGREPVAEKVIEDQLEWIIETVDAGGGEIEPEMGVATGWRRGKWAALRNDLLKTPSNVDSLKKIQNCLLVLCIDEPTAEDRVAANVKKSRATANGHSCAVDAAALSDEMRQRLEDEARIGQMLHGWGSRHNGANRW